MSRILNAVDNFFQNFSKYFLHSQAPSKSSTYNTNKN